MPVPAPAKAELNRRVNSFTQGWLEGALEKLPKLNADDNSKERIKNYIDRQFEKVDRETFKQQLKDAMAGITDDYEKGMKKGRQVSVSRPVGGQGAPEVKRLSQS